MRSDDRGGRRHSRATGGGSGENAMSRPPPNGPVSPVSSSRTRGRSPRLGDPSSRILRNALVGLLVGSCYGERRGHVARPEVAGADSLTSPPWPDVIGNADPDPEPAGCLRSAPPATGPPAGPASCRGPRCSGGSSTSTHWRAPSATLPLSSSPSSPTLPLSGESSPTADSRPSPSSSHRPSVPSTSRLPSRSPISPPLPSTRPRPLSSPTRRARPRDRTRSRSFRRPRPRCRHRRVPG